MCRRAICAAGVRPCRRRGRAGGVVVAGLLLALGCDSDARNSATSGPNIIFVVLDTLRADHLDLYGYPEATAPLLARVGAQSAVFSSAFSTSSWTAPSTASLFTGLYPIHHGVVLGLMARQRRDAEHSEGATTVIDRLPTSVATLPEHLKRQGYRTFGVATNINISETAGFDRGFDRFSSLKNAPAERVLQELRGWRAEIQQASPYFLYLHLDDVHKPYTRRAPWFKESETGDARADTVAAYDSEIHYVDGVLEEILGLFDFLPGGEGTGILMIASDHGEEFWDHGDDGHRFSLHYEVNRIVLMVSGPGIEPGVRGENVSGVDVLPTLLDLAGAPPSEPSDGRSLVQLLRAEEGGDARGLRSALAKRPLLAHRVDRRTSDKELWAVVVGPWKLIVTPEGNQLYDLSSDTAELRDLSHALPQRVAALQAELDRFREHRADLPASEVTLSLDPDDLEELRTLGYLDEVEEEVDASESRAVSDLRGELAP